MPDSLSNGPSIPCMCLAHGGHLTPWSSVQLRSGPHALGVMGTRQTGRNSGFSLVKTITHFFSCNFGSQNIRTGRNQREIRLTDWPG